MEDEGNDCMTSVDGADCRTVESGRKFYSHKYKKSAFRYEVALCIKTGWIVWINGPYEAGSWPDINIFRDSLKSHLEENERVEADDGYRGDAPEHIKCPKCMGNPEEYLFMQQRVRNRQETVNKRMKNWGALKQVWRHRFTGHAEVFRAVAVVTQMSIENGEPLFQCGYRDWLYDGDDSDNEMSSGSEFDSDQDSADNDEDLSYDSEWRFFIGRGEEGVCFFSDIGIALIYLMRKSYCYYCNFYFNYS